MPPAAVPTDPIPTTRVVALLGVGAQARPPDERYDLTTYVDAEGSTSVESRLCLMHHVVSARARGEEVELLAVGSPAARELWTAGVLQRLLDAAGVGDVPWAFFEVPEGTDQGDPAAFVGLLLPALRRSPSPWLPARAAPTEVVLDITHGFRSQSLLAIGAVEAVVDEALRAADGTGTSKGIGLRVLYGAYEARDKDAGVTPIWDLTGLSLQHLWSSAVHSFVRYGRADAFSLLCRDLGLRTLGGHTRDRARLDVKKTLDDLAGAAQELADGLMTARLAAVVTRLARRFVTNLTAARPALAKAAPASADALDRLAVTCEGLVAPTLLSPEGLRAGARLARLAYAMDRTSECVALLRELGVLQIALHPPADPPPPPVTCATCPARPASRPHPPAGPLPPPGTPGFSEAWGPFEGAFGARARATAPPQDGWELYARGVGRLRNDVQHAGLRSEALTPRQVREQCAKLLATLESLLQIDAGSGSAKNVQQAPASPSPSCVDSVTPPARGERGAPG